MGKKELCNFINDIPSAKLKDLPTRSDTTLFDDVNWHLDMQKMTNDKKHVLLVQVNSNAKAPNLKRVKGNTRSLAVTFDVQVPSGADEYDPEEVRKLLRAAAGCRK